MITKSVMKLVTDEVLHPIWKIQPLLIGCTATQRVQRDVTGAVPLARRGPCAAVVECVSDIPRLRSWGGVVTSNAHHTRVREPELRAPTTQQGCAGGQQATGEGPKPCGSGPSRYCANAAELPCLTLTLRTSA